MHSPWSPHGFDFDSWSRLAAEDPEAFERRRRGEVQAVIEQASPTIRQRLRALQWRVDRVRELAPNPLSACLRLNGMMWDRVLGRGGLLEALNGLGCPSSRTPAGRAGGTVVPLRAGGGPFGSGQEEESQV